MTDRSEAVALTDDMLDEYREHAVHGSGAYYDRTDVARLVNEIDRLRALRPEKEEAGLRERIDRVLYMIPEPDEYAYIEARVGSNNYRSESHFVIDRRGRPKEGRSGYENHPANDWLSRLAAEAAAVRVALAAPSQRLTELRQRIDADPERRAHVDAIKRDILAEAVRPNLDAHVGGCNLCRHWTEAIQRHAANTPLRVTTDD